MSYGFGALSQDPIGGLSGEISIVSARIAASSPLGSVQATVGAIIAVEAKANARTPLGSANVLARPVAIAWVRTSSPLGIAKPRAQVVALACAAAHTPLGACAARSTVLRYELRGEVRQDGVLINRRVRAYLRSSGALVAEGDTTLGQFVLHCGFSPQEFYLTPINLDEAATDWLPPTANRIVSVLAMDAP